MHRAHVSRVESQIYVKPKKLRVTPRRDVAHPSSAGPVNCMATTLAVSAAAAATGEPAFQVVRWRVRVTGGIRELYEFAPKAATAMIDNKRPNKRWRGGRRPATDLANHHCRFGTHGAIWAQASLAED